MWNPFKILWKEVKPYNHFKADYLTLLSLIRDLLKNNNSLQYEYIEELILCLNNEDYLEFKKLMNANDMWGGSGAVWDVILKDNNERFEKSIINIIDILEKSQRLNSRVKYIRKYLKSGISSNAVKWNKDEIKEIDI